LGHGKDWRLADLICFVSITEEENMAAFTTLQQSSLVQLYVGILGTTPTTAALNTYATIFASTSGTDAQKYDAVAAAMVASTAGQTKYPVFATAGQIADTMLGHLGLPGSAVGADGTSLKALAEGILAFPGVTVASFGRALLNALNTNTFTGADALSVAAATAKTAYGVSATGTPGTTLSAAVNTALGVVTETTTAQTISLTTSTDDLSGGAGNDTFTGLLGSTSTLNSGDKIDGKAGSDTLSVTNTATTSVLAELKNVETVSVKQVESASFDATLWTEVTKIVSTGGLAGKTLTVSNLMIKPEFQLDGGSTVSSQGLVASYIELTGTSDAASVTFTGVSGATVQLNTAAGALETVTINNVQASGITTLSGTAMSATTALTFSGSNVLSTLTVNTPVGNVTVGGAGSANINLTSTSTSTSVITIGADVDVTLSVSGAGNKSVTTGTKNDTVNLTGTGSGDGAISTGAGDDLLSITLAGNYSINMGDGADTIRASTSVSAGDTIAGGVGSDVLVAMLATGVTALRMIEVETALLTFAPGNSVNLANTDNLATIVVAGSGTNPVTINSADNTLTAVNWSNGTITGSNKIAYANDSAATLTIAATGAAASSSILFDEVATVTLSLSKPASGAGLTLRLDPDDTTTLTLRAASGGTITAINDSSALSTLAVTSSGSDTLTISSLSNASALTTLTLTAQSGVLQVGGAGSVGILPDAPILSQITLNAASGSIVFSGWSNRDVNSVTNLTITTGGGTAELHQVDLANVGNGSFTFTASDMGSSAGYVIFSGASTLYADEFYATVNASRLDGGYLKMATVGVITSGMANNGTRMTITGASGSDVLLGGNAADTITAGAGNDTVAAGSGADVIFGGLGNDSLMGNDGADTIYGQDGNDTITQGSGVGVFYGGSGIDNINTGSGADIVNFMYSEMTRTGETVANTVFQTNDEFRFTGTNTLTVNNLGTGNTISTTGTGGLALMWGTAGSVPLNKVSANQTLTGNTFTAQISGATLDPLLASHFAASGMFATNGLFSGTISFDGASGYGLGWFSGVSAATALILIEGTASSQLFVLESSGSGTQTLSTANVVSIINLTGYTGLVNANFN